MKRLLIFSAAILFFSTSAPTPGVAQPSGPHGKGRMMHENNRPGTIKGFPALGAKLLEKEKAIGALTPGRIATYDRLRGHAGGDRK